MTQFRYVVLSGAIASILGGCASIGDDDSSLDLALADKVEFMRPYELSRTDITLISLGPVSGRSCQANFFASKPTQDEAIIRLKIAAAEIDANRVVLRSCREEKTADCSASWVCEGQAYQVQPLR